MVKMLIIGGSGRTGLHLLEQAAQRGHTVRALVRKPEALRAPPGVALVRGTPERLEDLREAMRETEAVIVAHNNSRASDNPWAKQINSPTFMTDTARNILAVMDEQHVKRVVFVSAIGVGDSWPTVSWAFRAFIKLSNPVSCAAVCAGGATSSRLGASRSTERRTPTATTTAATRSAPGRRRARAFAETRTPNVVQ